MSLVNLLGIGTAYAATTASSGAAHPSTEASLLSMLPWMVVAIAIFYFLLIRPQNKRAKEQRQLLDNLTIGDEIVTLGGIVGRLTKLRDNFVVISIAKDVEITMQKTSVAQVLPKGTLDTIQ